jgi:geranylgeranyl transferase type-2 subunit beta
VLYTYSAVQALALCGEDPRTTLAGVDNLVAWVAGLQAADGSFSGDEFGDDDTRYTYAALATLRLLGRLDAVDRPAAARHLLRCRTPERAFGVRPGAEAHAGQTFCSVAALALCDELAEVASDMLLLMWLSERQNADGGVNGRPGKRSDVCYAWWVGATCAVLGRLDVIDQRALVTSVLAHQSDKGTLSWGAKRLLYYPQTLLTSLPTASLTNVATE